jgi:hypothetical protein
VVFFCLQFCRLFHKMMSEVENECIEDVFDLLLVAALVEEAPEVPKQVFIDQVDLGW